MGVIIEFKGGIFIELTGTGMGGIGERLIVFIFMPAVRALGDIEIGLIGFILMERG
jgi:hypothetical protein